VRTDREVRQAIVEFMRGTGYRPATARDLMRLLRIDRGRRHEFKRVLRDLLNLTGTKFGCGVGECGACTIHENGAAVRACQIPLSQTAGKRYTTIEGLSAKGDHPCQRAWIEEDVVQCGYCQPGQIMEAIALVHRVRAEGREITEADLDGIRNICRCGTYPRIREAIVAGAARM